MVFEDSVLCRNCDFTTKGCIVLKLSHALFLPLTIRLVGCDKVCSVISSVWQHRKQANACTGLRYGHIGAYFGPPSPRFDPCLELTAKPKESNAPCINPAGPFQYLISCKRTKFAHEVCVNKQKRAMQR